MQPPSGPRPPGTPPPGEPPPATPPLGVPAGQADPPWTAQPPGGRRTEAPPPGGRQGPPTPDPRRSWPAPPEAPPPPDDRGLDVFIRRAVVGDAKAIALLIDRADARYARIAPPLLASAERLARWDRLVRAPSWWAFVAVEPGRLLGVVSGTVSVTADGEPVEGITHVDSLAVEPEKWGLGIGRQLLVTAVSAMPALGWRGAELWTQEPNARARRLYESTGWRPTGVRRWHPMAGCHIVQYSITPPPPAP